ncbi:RNA polymerase sigma factor [Anoxynatronum buryatiense]|uniref:RNA polymerase sigma-70 factor, ECF subfamily n=1 Tax=Anoxynatronum buryatiense TaxID=489973 RepID=A0AA45WTJ8_9CLOT|nr:RNA polymerase sigma factor [Anoxynatronum buryatiense]SMP41269.1 RNA polymerase sigma-70 factor, ECF subfamily [Anoxynatronum buryatiense]
MLQFLMVIPNPEIRSKLEMVYLKYQKVMYYMALKILKNPQDAQDVVQASVIKLAPYMEKMEDIDCNKTKAYIVTVVRNTSIDLYRKKQRRSLVPFDDIEDQIPDEADSMDNVMIRVGDAAWIKEKLKQLKPEYAEVLMLKYYSDFKDQEIADTLSIPKANVRVRLSRARAALRKLVEKEAQREDREKCAYE